MQNTAVRFIPALLWMSLIFYISHQPNVSISSGNIDFVLRKIAHITEYGILTGLLAFGFRTITRQTLLISTSIALLYAISDEFHQTFIPTRNGTPIDVIIDSIGIVLAFVLLQYWHARKYSQP